MANSQIDKLKALLTAKRYDDAATFLETHPDCTDMRGLGGEVMQWIIKQGSFAVMQSFLGHVQHMTPEDYAKALFNAVLDAKPHTLRAVVEARPDILTLTPTPHKPLYELFQKYQQISQLTPTNASLADLSDKFRACSYILMEQAGALEVQDGGCTPLAAAIVNTGPFYCNYLVRHGADIQARMPDGETIADLYQQDKRASGPSVISQVRKNYEALQLFVQEEREALQKTLSEKTPEEIVQAYRTDEAVRDAVHVTLSADYREMLTDPGYWKKHGGLPAATEFVGALQALIPNHLAYMRERFEYVGLLREEPTPREGSVMVEYVHGSAATRREYGA